MELPRFRFTLAGAFLATIALTGCAAHQLPAAAVQGAHTIGVVSGLGDSVHFARMCVVVFGNAKSDDDITDWHVDDQLLAGAKAALAGKYTVIARKGDPEVLAPTSAAPGGKSLTDRSGRRCRRRWGRGLQRLICGS
jgi:hypothetical protein